MSVRNAFAAFRVRTTPYSRAGAPFRDETIEQQRLRRENEQRKNEKLHAAWLKELT